MNTVPAFRVGGFLQCTRILTVKESYGIHHQSNSLAPPHSSSEVHSHKWLAAPHISFCYREASCALRNTVLKSQPAKESRCIPDSQPNQAFALTHAPFAIDQSELNARQSLRLHWVVCSQYSMGNYKEKGDLEVHTTLARMQESRVETTSHGI
jgi:hypothetical protein